MTNFELFCSDDTRLGRYLYEVHYKDVDGVAGVLYFSSSEYGTLPTDTPANLQYDARVGNEFAYTGVGGNSGEGGLYPMVGLLPAREGGTFTVKQKYGDLDYLRAFNFDNQKIVIKYGGESKYGTLAYADYREVFNGVSAGQPLIGMDEVTFVLRNRDSLLQFPVQTAKYHGGDWCIYGANEIDFTNNSVYDFTFGEPFTFEFWYFPVTASLLQYIVSRGLDNVNGYHIFQDASNRLVFRTNQSGTHQDTISTALTMERWQQVAITFDGVSSCGMVINGVDAIFSSAIHSAPVSSTEPLYFLHDEAGGNHCDCMIKEIRISKLIRSRAQIGQRMNRQLNDAEIADTNYIGYWKCDDGTGTTLRDDSVTGQDGTVDAGAAWFPSLQGGAELQGATIIDCWGEKYGLKPVLVSAQHSIYQVHSSFIEGIMTDGVLEGLNPVEEDGPPNPYIYNFLLGTTAPGKYELLNAPMGSYIRFGSAPSLPVSVNLKGDKSDGTYRDRPAALARYISTTRGQFKLNDAVDIDDAAFDAMDATVDIPVGWATYDETLVGDLIATILGGVGISAFFKRNGGRLTVRRYDGVTASAVGVFSREDVKRMSLEPLDAGPPVHSVSIAWRKNDVVHGAKDIAGAVAGTEAVVSGMVDWRIAHQGSPVTLERHPGASFINIESAIVNWADASKEASRLQTLYGKIPQAFKATFKHRSLSLERLDIIGFYYEDFLPNGDAQLRFGTEVTYFFGNPFATQFVVLNIEDAPNEGGSIVTFSREDNTAGPASPSEE